MFKRVLLTAVSVAALTVGAAAQDNSKGPNGAGAGGAPQAAQGGANSARDVAPGQTKEQGQSAREEAPGQNKTGKSARDEAPGHKKDQGSTGASDGSSGSSSSDKRSENKQGAESKSAKGDREDKDHADRKAERDGGKSRAAEEDRGRNGDRADRDHGRDDRGATGISSGESGAARTVTVTEEQRSRAKSVFVRHRDDAVVRDINISLNIGVVVPRSVRLHHVPADIIAIVPAYSDYEYFIYEDKVVIVDPASFEIVDIVIIA